MSLERELQNALFSFTKGDSEKLQEVADLLGVSSSYLYRICNPDDDQAQMKVVQFFPFMRATGSIAPLRWLARRLGCAVVKVPARVKRPGPKTVIEVQQEYIDGLKALAGYVDGSVNGAEAVAKITETIELLISLRRDIERGAELRLEDPQCQLFSART